MKITGTKIYVMRERLLFQPGGTVFYSWFVVRLPNGTVHTSKLMEGNKTTNDAIKWWREQRGIYPIASFYKTISFNFNELDYETDKEIKGYLK